MKKEARLLLDKAIDSLILSVESFNRPWDQGRVVAVLILLDHSFEMLLKASILQKGGRIRDPKASQTLGFDACVRKAFSDGNIKFLGEEDTLLLQAINSLRDAAQHHLLDISEQNLYMQAQAGLSLFRKLLKAVFKQDLRDKLPSRVLPISTEIPTDLTTLFDTEVQEIKKLLKPGTRHKIEALAKIRGLAILEGAIQGERVQPSQGALRKIGSSILAGTSWEKVFPGVASINITATGIGPSIELRITKKEGIPIQLVKEGTPGAAVVGIRRVNELDFYNLGHNQLAEKLGISSWNLTAIIWHVKLRNDIECHKEIQIGASRFHRYSQKAINVIEESIKSGKLDVGKVWDNYKNRKKAAAKSAEQALAT